MGRTEDRVRRLTGIPGIGSRHATFLVAAVGSAATFDKEYDIAHVVGLVMLPPASMQPLRADEDRAPVCRRNVRLGQFAANEGRIAISSEAGGNYYRSSQTMRQLPLPQIES
jgi:hypothetical protein